MKTSCVVLNYNDYETTMTLLENIRNYQVFDNIVIVDNCSTDDSFELLRRNQNEKIRVIQTEKNGGYGYGNNIGIRYSYEQLNSSYILIINPDVEFDEECILELLRVLINNKDVAVCSAIPKQPNGEFQPLVAWRVPKKIEYILSH